MANLVRLISIFQWLTNSLFICNKPTSLEQFNYENRNKVSNLIDLNNATTKISNGTFNIFRLWKTRILMLA